MNKMNIAIYPGSFDLLTLGHLDVIQRAASMFTTLLVGVLHNKEKSPLFSIEERVRILEEATAHLPNVRVKSFDGLLVHFARENGAHIVIRGLRAITDFDYELQIAQTNRILSDGGIDTIFLATSLEYAYLSSSTVRQIAAFGGDISKCVLPFIAEAVYDKLGNKH